MSATWADVVKDIPIHPSLTATQPAAGDSGQAPAGGGGQEHAPAAAEPENQGTAPESAPGTEEPPAGAELPVDEGEGEGAEPESQTPEERSANAERRRKYEARMQKKITEALEEARRGFAAELETAKNEVVASLGLIDPATGKPIADLKGLEAFRRAADEQRINAGLSKAGLERETITALIESHPDVIAARQLKQQAQTQTSRVLDAEAEAKLKAELAEIQKYSPEVKAIEHLIALPEYPQIQKLVQSGLSISEAHFLINRKNVLEKTRAAAVQDAMNKINGKGHLQADAVQGKLGEEMPAAIRKQFREAYPDLSEAELRKKYERVQSLQKKG